MRQFIRVVAGAVVIFAGVLGYAVSQEPRNHLTPPAGFQAVDESPARRQLVPSSPGEVGRYQFHVGNADLSCGRSVLVDTATGRCWLLRDWKEWKELGNPAELELVTSSRQPLTPATSPPGDLKLAIAGLKDQQSVGNEVTYDIRVTNDGATDVQQAIVVVAASAEMSPAAAGSGGPIKFVITGQSFAYDAVPSIRAGETLRYQARFRAEQVGTARIKAELRLPDSPWSIVAEESTTIVADE
jgi:hypothetical protein